MRPRHSVSPARQARVAREFLETGPRVRCPARVIRRHVLAAVDAGVAAGDDDAARAALRRVDWILRGQARRRLEHALIEAALATGVLVVDAPVAARHVLRAAGLILRDRRDVELADPDQVARAYEATVVATPSRVPIASIVASIIALTAATAVATAAVFVATHAPPGVYAGPPPPEPIGAYRDGGAPLRDRMIEQVLAVELTHLVVASDAGSGSPEPGGGELRRQARALRGHPAFIAYGGGLTAAWRAMIDSLARWGALTAADPGYHRATDDLRARVHVATDQLAGVGLGYFLDPEIFAEHGRRHAGIFAYRVEHVAFVRAARDRVRVLSLRRLDQLNVSLALLGMKPEALRDPIVLLDQIEDHVRTQVLPVVAGGLYEVGDDAWNRSAQGRSVAAVAGDAIRRELMIALGPDATTADRAAANLARHGFRRTQGTSAEAYVAVVVLEGLARRLHVAAVGPALHDGAIDRDRLSALVAPLAARSTAELRSAAAALWAELFGDKLARIVDE